MQPIFNFLKTVWQDVKQEQQSNITFIGLLLLGITIPLALNVNNSILIGSLLMALFSFKKENLTFSKAYIPLVLFFVWTALSYFWTIDSERTLKAIPKGLILIVLPFLFYIKKDFFPSTKNKLIHYYSYTIVLYVMYYLLRASIRYVRTGIIDVFFYHELVTKDVNAIHVTVFVALAFFYFLNLKNKNRITIVVTLFLFAFILLLSSKLLITVVVLLSGLKLVYDFKKRQSVTIKPLYVVVILVVISLFSYKFRTRFTEEKWNNSTTYLQNGTRLVSVKEAWSQEKFSPNDYFSGSALRVYQIRMFTEFIQEEPIFFQGFGLNASYLKLEEKAEKYNIFRGNDTEQGYQTKNYHNQYVQNFAELGFIGFFILLTLLAINLKRAVLNKDFIHFVFAILMISLFLTESFLWRQRGIVFFVYFYCLFNSNFSLKNYTT